jgi:hypothetical protein
MIDIETQIRHWRDSCLEELEEARTRLAALLVPLRLRL